MNFRIHRLSLMQYRQKEEESLDEFVTRVRTQAQMCEFEDKEMQERIIELVIAGTKMEVFRRELLGKEKGLGCKSGLSSWANAVFYIVDVPGPVILGLSTCDALNLVTINCQLESMVTTPVKVTSVQDLMNMYPGQFDTVGKFTEPTKIRLKEDAEPHVDRPRKCNINLKPKIEAELKQMEDTCIIRKVREHTDWCSIIVYSTKSVGSLRICLDPKRLNESIKRGSHKMPTLEGINPAFVGAKHFGKLDAKARYWRVQLEEQSQLLVIFRTPFGRYCYQRLPFGLCVSQDIFQQRMDEILESLEGCVGIADICIFGPHRKSMINGSSLSWK